MCINFIGIFSNHNWDFQKQPLLNDSSVWVVVFWRNHLFRILLGGNNDSSVVSFFCIVLRNSSFFKPSVFLLLCYEFLTSVINDFGTAIRSRNNIEFTQLQAYICNLNFSLLIFSFS